MNPDRAAAAPVAGGEGFRRGRQPWHHSAFPVEVTPMSARRSLLLALLAAPFLLLGCKIETINYFPDKFAKVRFANVIYGAASVSGYVDGTNVWPDTAFEAVTAYQNFEPVQHSFALLVPGNPGLSSGSNYTLNGNSNYTIFAFGTPGVPTTAALLEPTTTPGNNSFQTRVLNLAPNVASLDLYVLPPGGDIVDASPNVSGLAYGSIGVYIDFSAGDYRIVAANTDTKVPIFDSGTVSFPPNTRANLVAYSRGGASLITMALFETTGNATITPLNNLSARVRAVNIGNPPESSNRINVLADQKPLFDAIDYGTGSLPARLDSRTFEFSAEAVATPGAALASISRTLRSATDTTLYLKGDPGAQSLVALDDNNTPALSNAGRLRIVNAAGNPAPVDVLAGTTVLASGVTPTTPPFYLEIATGTYALTVRDTATGTTLATVDTYNAAVGSVFTLYIAGTATQATASLVQDR